MKSEAELLEKARASYDSANWTTALEDFDRLIKACPDCLAGWCQLADVHTILGKPRSAIEALTAAIALRMTAEGVDECLPLIARLLELDPYHEEVQQQRIDLLFLAGRSDEAIVYSRILAQHFLNEDRGEAAIKMLVRCFQLKPGDVDLIQFLAEAYLSHGQMREATGLFRQALPHYLNNQDWERAAQILRRLTVVNPQDAQSFLELGDLYVKLERYQDADQQFRAVLRNDLSNREALLRVADVSVRRQQWRDATMVYQRLITLCADDAEAHYGLGRIYQQQGMASDAIKHLLMAGLACVDDNKDRARACFETVLKLDPANGVAARQIKVLV